MIPNTLFIISFYFFFMILPLLKIQVFMVNLLLLFYILPGRIMCGWEGGPVMELKKSLRLNHSRVLWVYSQDLAYKSSKQRNWCIYGKSYFGFTLILITCFNIMSFFRINFSVILSWLIFLIFHITEHFHHCNNLLASFWDFG